MDGNDIEIRFQQASKAANPADALYVLAKSLKSEDMSQREMYDLFDHHREQHRIATDEKLHDAIMDTMDHIIGWTTPKMRLFEKPFNPAYQHLYATFVEPFYMLVLHGNYGPLLVATEDSERRQNFIRRVRTTLEIVDRGVVDFLFQDGHWRGCMAAGWFCVLKGWRQYSDLMGHLLLPSRHCYAGQAYCIAFACFADENSARYLCRYLDKYLRQPENHYDQFWAMPALVWIDRKRGTNYSGPFIKGGGLWDQFFSRLKYQGRPLYECQHRFDRLMEATITTFGIG